MKVFKKGVIALLMAIVLASTPVSAQLAEVQTVQAATIKLNKTALSLYIGYSKQLKITGTSKKVTWSSENEDIAIVTEKGTVIAVAKGSTTIKATVGGKTYSCKITVKSPSINKKSAPLEIGDTLDLDINGALMDIKWYSSNTTIASVDNFGVVTALKEGTAIIVGKCNGKKYKCTVTVTKKVVVIESIDAKITEEASVFNGADKTVEATIRLFQDTNPFKVDLSSIQQIYKEYGYDTEGLYIALNNEAEITVEVYDKDDKCLGIEQGSGSLYIEYPKASYIIVKNAKNHFTAYFFPCHPTIITGEGSYDYDDFQWTKLPQGNIRAYYLLMYKNNIFNMDYTTKAIKVTCNRSESIGSFEGIDVDKLPEGITPYWHAGYLSSIGSNKVSDLSDLIFIAGESHIYYEDDSLMLYGKSGITVNNEFVKNTKSLISTVKDIAESKYIPNSSALQEKVNITFFSSFPSSVFPEVSLNDECLDLSDLRTWYTYAHELTHFYHSAIYNYGFEVMAWSEGMAQALAEDAMYDAGKINQQYLHLNYNFADYKLNGNGDFENYFVSVFNVQQDQYAVGYYFIKYIQKQYGDDVVKRINADVCSSIKYPYSKPHSDARDEAFIKCIKDNTSATVFTDFVQDVIGM